MENRSKKKSTNTDFNSGFSDDDVTDEDNYEDDFINESSDDSFEKYLHSKMANHSKSKPSVKPLGTFSFQKPSNESKSLRFDTEASRTQKQGNGKHPVSQQPSFYKSNKKIELGSLIEDDSEMMTANISKDSHHLSSSSNYLSSKQDQFDFLRKPKSQRNNSKMNFSDGKPESATNALSSQKSNRFSLSSDYFDDNQDQLDFLRKSKFQEKTLESNFSDRRPEMVIDTSKNRNHISSSSDYLHSNHDIPDFLRKPKLQKSNSETRRSDRNEELISPANDLTSQTDKLATKRTTPLSPTDFSSGRDSPIYHNQRIKKGKGNPLSSLLDDEPGSNSVTEQHEQFGSGRDLMKQVSFNESPRSSTYKKRSSTVREDYLSEYRNSDSVALQRERFGKNSPDKYGQTGHHLQLHTETEYKEPSLKSKYMDYLLGERTEATGDSVHKNDNTGLNKQASQFQKFSSDDQHHASQRSKKSKAVVTPSTNSQLKSIENINITDELSRDEFLDALPSFEKSKSTSPTADKRSKKKPKPRNRKAQRPASITRYSQREGTKETTKQSGDVDGDLLALFEQIAVTKRPITFGKEEEANVPVPDKKLTMLPSEALALSVMKETRGNYTRPSSRHLVDNVIHSVAAHNHDRNLTDEYIKEEHASDETSKTKRLRSAKKKPFNKPPADYKGLGSLTALQKLRKYKVDTDTAELASTTDLRTAAYMQWLADREKKLKKKKKTKLEEAEKENEKKQKEKEEKFFENGSARRVWLERKLTLVEEEEKKKKIERRKKKEEKKIADEERFKSSKRAEVARSRLLIEARKRHQLETRAKKEEEMIKEQKKDDKKREVERAVAKWNEERNMRWEADRKREIQEQKTREKAKKEYENEKREKAKMNFQRWQAKKRGRFQSGNVNYHFEEREPWCPPYKNSLRATSA